MGQKTHPTGNRLGFIKGWDSNWYGGKNYVDKIVEDDKIRKYLRARLVKASMSRVVIERTMKLVTVTIHTARPGVIIGKGGQQIQMFQQQSGARIQVTTAARARDRARDPEHEPGRLGARLPAHERGRREPQPRVGGRRLPGLRRADA